MAGTVTGPHHHAICMHPSLTDRMKGFYERVLRLEADPGRPNIPGVPGYWMDLGETQIHLMAKDGPSPYAKAPDKDRFDFYKILPGGEEPKLAGRSADRAAPDKAAAAKPEPARPPEKVAAAEPSAAKGAKTGDRFWLQAGSFAQETDAENLKARLALAGWEAQVQPGTLPDKAVRYRVRLGPYDNVEELNRIKAQLAQRGYDAAVIKY